MLFARHAMVNVLTFAEFFCILMHGSVIPVTVHSGGN